MTIPPALGPLYAGYVHSPSQPIGIVGLGSSTMDAGGEIIGNRWFTKLVTQMQELSPGPSHNPIVVDLEDPTISLPGIHGYNGGQGGTTAADYLGQARLNRIAQIQPVAIFHCVGSNDYARNVAPSDYYTRMNAAISQIDAVMNRPYVNILIHAHMRAGTFQYHFNNYRDALIRLGKERANCHFLDVGAPFFYAGVPRQDSFDLLHTDNTHLTTVGQDFFYRVVAEEVTSAAFLQPTKVIYAKPGIVASDSFDASNYTEIAGRTLDNKIGGYATKKWEAAPKQVCTYYQRLCRLASATDNFAALIQMDLPDHELSATIHHLPENSAVYMSVRRQAPSVATPADDYRLVINPSGSLQLIKRVSTATTLLATAPEPVNLLDRVTIRAQGSRISVHLNGSEVISVTDSSITAPGWAGFTGTGTTHAFQFENVTFTHL